MASEVTNVKIIPGRANSIATALRGHISAVLAYMRMDNAELMEESIRCMRRDMTIFEREVRLNVEE